MKITPKIKKCPKIKIFSNFVDFNDIKNHNSSNKDLSLIIFQKEKRALANPIFFKFFIWKIRIFKHETNYLINKIF
jgi:hypothetical protein